MKSADNKAIAEKIYHDWAEAVATHDVDALTALYDADAILESPLVNTLLKSESGVVKGKEALRHFFTVLFSTDPVLTDRHRESFFTDGRTMIWEYPRVTPVGEQTEMAEVMEISNGLIAAHRVYWGWSGGKLLQKNQYGEAHKAKS
jgi:hypothetical protein